MSEHESYPKPPRKILVVSHYYDSHGGGIERTVRRLIGELAADGSLAFTWAASADDGHPLAPDLQNPARILPADNISGAPLPTDPRFLPMKSYNALERLTGMPWPVWGLRSLRRLRDAIRQSDFVWLHDALYMGNIIAFRLAKAANKPIIITQHIGTIPYRNPLWRGLMQLADRLFTRRMLRHADQAVFVSDWVAEHYHRHVAFKRPVIVIPNGVDSKIFSPVSGEQRRNLRAQLAVREDQPVLLFVGRFIEKKGLAVIERLSTLLPEWRFWLAGQGPIDPEQWYRPNVHVFRGREEAALADLYRAADLFVLPSFGEGFPLVVQEAMACGLPVLCSPVTAAGSQLAKPFLLTAAVDPKSPARTAEAWMRRLKPQREYLPLTHANMDLAQAAHYFWSWPKIAKCYAAIFRNLERQKST